MDRKRLFFFLQSHWLVFSSTILMLHLAVILWAPKWCCPEQSNPQDILHKQLAGVLLPLSPAAAVAAAFHEASLVTVVVLALQGHPGLPRFSTACTSSSCQRAWGESWNVMRISEFEPEQTKGKEEQGEKILVLLYQFTHLLPKCKKPTAFTGGTAIPPLSQHPSCPSFFSDTYLCAQVSHAYLLPPETHSVQQRQSWCCGCFNGF